MKSVCLLKRFTKELFNSITMFHNIRKCIFFFFSKPKLFFTSTYKGKASTIKFKSLETCPGFFVGGSWFRKYEFSKIPAAAFFSCFFSVKHFEKHKQS